MATTEKKKVLMDRRDVLNDILTNVAPRYFVDDFENLDKNILSIFGNIQDTEARAIEDTLILENNRAEDYCPELSTNEYHVRQTARLRNIPITMATPATAVGVLRILKADILEKGTTIGNDIYFTIDRRSEIINNNVHFGLEDDILIRAMRTSNVASSYVYTAVYTGTDRQYRTFVQLADSVNAYNEEELLIYITLYQHEYNIQERTVVDEMAFQCDGIDYEYNNSLVDFDIYWRASDSDEFIKLYKKHKLAEAVEDDKIYIDYVDDEPGVITIYGKPELGITINSNIKLEIIESLGADGNTPIGSDNTSFTLYTDGGYNYAGVSIGAQIISDPYGGKNGDDLESLKRRLILEKTTRNNITTMLDIHNYLDDVSANTQIVKKRNDVIECIYGMYTLLRYNDNISPAATKDVVMYLEDFDIKYNDKVCGISANRKWYLDETDDVLRPYPNEEPEMPYDYIYNVPFMIRLNSYNVLQYFNPSINGDVELGVRTINDGSPYQFITNAVQIKRDAVNPDNDIATKYTFEIIGAMNTSSDNLYVNQDGTIIDKDKFKAFCVLKNGSAPTAYLPINLTSYIPKTRTFKLSGAFNVLDYITDNNTILVTGGLYTLISGEPYTNFIDFKDTKFEIILFYKQGAETEGIAVNYSTDAHNNIPNMENYFWMNTYENKVKFNFMLEMNHYCRSALTIREDTEGGSVDENPNYGKLIYRIDEVPALEYNYSIENSKYLYDVYLTMYTKYTGLVAACTNFEVSLKFINTYCPSKYINIIGTAYNPEDTEFKETSVPLNDLNPSLSFKVYAKDINVNEIKQYILEYFRDTYIMDGNVFISNLCSKIEETFDITSIKFLGLVTKKANYDATYQHFEYLIPIEATDSIDGLIDYIPEQLHITNIIIDLDEIDT